MIYRIRSANRLYIKTLSFDTTTRVETAYIFRARDKAQNIVDHMKKTIKHLDWEVVEYDDGIEEDAEDYVPTLPISELEAKVKHIENCVKQLDQRRTYLIHLLNQVDQEIIDIEHAAEFYQLDAARGYKLYKMLRDARIRRRDYKNEIKKICIIQEATFEDYRDEKVSKSFEGMEHRKYRPRVLEELFGT